MFCRICSVLAKISCPTIVPHTYGPAVQNLPLIINLQFAPPFIKQQQVRWPSWLWRQVKVILTSLFLVTKVAWVRIHPPILPSTQKANPGIRFESHSHQHSSGFVQILQVLFLLLFARVVLRCHVFAIRNRPFSTPKFYHSY